MECIVNINQGYKNLIELYIKHSQRKYNILAVEQYGSRKKMSSILCALNKRLIFDVMVSIAFEER